MANGSIEAIASYNFPVQLLVAAGSQMDSEVRLDFADLVGEARWVGGTSWLQLSTGSFGGPLRTRVFKSAEFC
jgi:hypothetical protein